MAQAYHTYTVAMSREGEGRTALVTGAAQGFGKGIAEGLFREGANIVIADLNEQAGLASIQQWNARAARLRKANPGMLEQLGLSEVEMPAGTAAPGSKPKLDRNRDGTYTYSP